VTTAEHGRRALELLRAGLRPGVILLDLMMPVMNGWQFRDEQAHDPQLSPIPVLIISGDGRVAEKTTALGAAGYLRKPIDLDVLLGTVARFVRPELAAGA
jgi:two-component system response regulator MprA